jgi:hypothetical protein
MKIRHPALALVGLLVPAMTVGGCDEGLVPGDYIVYRVSATEPELGSSCFDGGAVPANVANDQSTFRATGTVILYAGPEEQFFLDIGSQTLEGEAEEGDEGDVYTFAGSSVDVEVLVTGTAETRLTTKVSTTVVATVDGEVISGESTTTTSFGCEGPACVPLPPKCTATNSFIGTEVEELQLEHGVDGDGSSITPPPAVAPAPPPPPECTTCGESLFEGPANMCDESVPNWQSLFSCGCGLCPTECGSTCVEGLNPSAECQGCLSFSCTNEYDTCQFE